MELTYVEIKEDMKDSFQSLYQNANYPARDAFYATLNDYQIYNSSTQTEECCIYVSFALILLQNKENIDFMKKRLSELMKKSNFYLYQKEMKEEFRDLENDIEILKTKI